MATTRSTAVPPWIRRRARRRRLGKLADWGALAVLLGPFMALLAIACGNLLLILYGQLFT